MGSVIGRHELHRGVCRADCDLEPSVGPVPQLLRRTDSMAPETDGIGRKRLVNAGPSTDLVDFDVRLWQARLHNMVFDLLMVQDQVKRHVKQAESHRLRPLPA